MKSLFIFGVLLAAIAVVKGGVTREEDEMKHAIELDGSTLCENRSNGRYNHPTTCNRFIVCINKKTLEVPCAPCHKHPHTCPDGALVFSKKVGVCLIASLAKCEIDNGEDSTTEAPGSEEGSGEATTEAPGSGENSGSSSEEGVTTEGPGSGENSESGEGSGASSEPSESSEENSQSSEETSEESSESKESSEEDSSSSEEDEPPQAGQPCNPDLCKTVGYCQSYLRCDKDSGKWVAEDCGQDLAWNPKGDGEIHGGNCDFWDSLDDETTHKYRSDPECLACFWREIEACHRDYLYQAPGLNHRNVQTLSCADGLVFSEAKETCQRCEDIDGPDGKPCCSGK